MTPVMFIFLLLWIAYCTAKPEKKRWIDSVRITDDGRTFEERLRDYGKR